MPISIGATYALASVFSQGELKVVDNTTSKVSVSVSYLRIIRCTY